MHHVLRVSEVPLQEPDQDRVHARGYRRAPLVDHGCGAVHTGLGLCQLEAGGTLDRHLHSYEESFFVLEGAVILEPDGRAYRLETLSPEPRSHPRDTFFLGGEVPHTAERPDLADPSVRFLGHFEDSQLPPPHYLQMDGYSGGNVEGISLKMMVDRVLGAQHLTMFMVEFQPGGAGNVHDHPFEECYFLLAGQADAVLDGKRYRVRAGDVVWTGVGGTHGFFNTGQTPVRWIETQAPQPPGQQAFRFAADWEHLERKLGYSSPQEVRR